MSFIPDDIPDDIISSHDLTITESNKVYNESKLEVVRRMKNVQIRLNYDDNAYYNSCRVNKRNVYTIVLNNKIPIREACDHELSHIKFDSIIKKVWTKLDALCVYAKEKYGKDCDSYIRKVFNIMEDIRIESCDGYIYAGRKVMFDKVCFNEGVPLQERERVDASDELLSYRFKRPDLVSKEHKKEIEDIWNKCNLTTTNGIFKVLKEWMDNGSLNDSIINMVEEENKRTNKIDELRSRIGGCTMRLGELEQKINKENHDRKQLPTNDPQRVVHDGEIERLTKEIEEITQLQAGYTIDRRQLQAQEKPTENTLVMPHDSHHSSTWHEKHVKDIDKIDVSKEDKKTIKLLEELKRKESASMMTKKASTILTPELIRNPEILTDIQTTLVNTFKAIKERNISKLCEDGDDIDIEALLECRKKGDPNFMTNDAKTDGVSILVSIDASGSMDGHRIKFCRDMMATMFKSVGTIPYIRLKAITFAGSCSDDVVAYREINNFHDCRYIGCQPRFSLTPTADALMDSYNKLLTMKGKKKILVFLTDGMPEKRDAFGIKVDDDVMSKTVMKTMAMIKNDKRIESHIVIVFNDGTSDKRYHELFLHKSIMLNDSKRIKSFMQTIFKKAIMSRGK